MYYYSTKENPQQCIAATIWDPDAVTATSVDERAMQEIAEHINAIEESMKQIATLSQGQVGSVNPIVRQHQIKEEHCDRLRKIVSYHFMSQRVEAVKQAPSKARDKYIRELTLLHELLVLNMKAKQTPDLAITERMRTLLAQFRAAYLEAAKAERRRSSH